VNGMVWELYAWNMLSDRYTWCTYWPVWALINYEWKMAEFSKLVELSEW